MKKKKEGPQQVLGQSKASQSSPKGQIEDQGNTNGSTDTEEEETKTKGIEEEKEEKQMIET